MVRQLSMCLFPSCIRFRIIRLLIHDTVCWNFPEYLFNFKWLYNAHITYKRAVETRFKLSNTIVPKVRFLPIYAVSNCLFFFSAVSGHFRCSMSWLSPLADIAVEEASQESWCAKHYFCNKVTKLYNVWTSHHQQSTATPFVWSIHVYARTYSHTHVLARSRTHTFAEKVKLVSLIWISVVF